MKKIKFLAMMAVAVLFASCMGDSYAGTDENVPSPYGNNQLEETNVISIGQLKNQFASYITTDYRNGVSYTKIADDIKIKGIVTSTDVSGNIYQEIALQDESGAIIVAVAATGLYGSLPVGSEVLVSLKDLYIGNYGLQAEIGVPTTNASGATYVGRMPQNVWEQHYKVLSTGKTVTPTEFNINTWSLDNDGGKLGILKNVTFTRPTSGNYVTYADANGGAGSISWVTQEIPSNKLIVYNSNYSKFATDTVPTNKKVNITGIFKRFNNQWEVIIRTLDDVEKLDTAVTPATLAGTGEGTQTSPYDVTRALALLNAGSAPTATVYVKGKISQVDEVNLQYKNAQYYLSDDGNSDNQIMIFRGKYIDGADFTADNQSAITLGKTVLLKGVLTNYNGTLEIKNSSIVTIN